MYIFALSSGRGPSGIAIIRISGSETLKICKDLMAKYKELDDKVYKRNDGTFNSTKKNKILEIIKDKDHYTILKSYELALIIMANL